MTNKEHFGLAKLRLAAAEPLIYYKKSFDKRKKRLRRRSNLRLWNSETDAQPLQHSGHNAVHARNVVYITNASGLRFTGMLLKIQQEIVYTRVFNAT